MDYRPLLEALCAGPLQRLRLSRAAVKRLLKQTDFAARLPAQLGTARIDCGKVLDWCRPVMDLLAPEPPEG